MKSSSRADIAIIGGSGVEDLLKEAKPVRIATPYGFPPPVSVGEIEGKIAVFLPRHGINHAIPPHRLNNRANISALHKLGVKRIFATNAVGALNSKFKLGDFVIPHDFVDYTKNREQTFYDSSPVTHIDMSKPFCPEIQSALMKATEHVGKSAWNKAVIACTEGPRYETPAEVKMLQHVGCDVVGMTTLPEAVLARELEICYASLCYITNLAAGLQAKQSVSELTRFAEENKLIIREVLKKAITLLPEIRNCKCVNALKDARL